MKKLVFCVLVSLAFLLACNKSNEKKAQDMIKSYILENANDPNSYESIEFGNIDTIYTHHWDDSTYQAINNSKYEFLNDPSIVNDPNFDVDKHFDSLNNALEAYEKNFKGVPSKLIMTHKFRANNSFGAKVINTTSFYFDTELSRIDSTENF